MKKILLAAVLLVASAIAVGFARPSDNSGTETQANDQQLNAEQQLAENEVLIDNFAFQPEKLVITRGTTVTWTNKDSARHNVDFTDDTLADGPLLSQDETFQYTFNDVGIFNYICTPHPYMTGQVEVI